jgi:Flp pilus assembly protein TadG
MNCAVISRRLTRSLVDRLHNLAADQSGVSAVEFAVLLPLMMTLYLGGVEISQAVGADRKVTLVARTVGDLAAQVASISVNDMTNIFNAGKAVLIPYDSSKISIKLTNVTIDSTGKATVCWSQTYPTGTQAESGDVSSKIPPALKVASTTLIWAEVAYQYTPTIGYVVTGTLNLTDQIFMRPRLTTSVSYDGSTC